MAPGFPPRADMADRITAHHAGIQISERTAERPRTCHPFPSSRRGPHDAGTRTSAARGMQDIPPVPAQPGRNRPPCPAAFFPTSARPMIFPCFFQGPDGEGADSVSRRMTGIPEVIGGTGHTTSIVRTNHRGSSGHSPFRICRVFPSASGMNAPAGRFSFRARQVFIQFRHANTVALGRSYMTRTGLPVHVKKNTKGPVCFASEGTVRLPVREKGPQGESDAATAVRPPAARHHTVLVIVTENRGRREACGASTKPPGTPAGPVPCIEIPGHGNLESPVGIRPRAIQTTCAAGIREHGGAGRRPRHIDVVLSTRGRRAPRQWCKSSATDKARAERAGTGSPPSRRRPRVLSPRPLRQVPAGIIAIRRVPVSPVFRGHGGNRPDATIRHHGFNAFAAMSPVFRGNSPGLAGGTGFDHVPLSFLILRHICRKTRIRVMIFSRNTICP